MSMNINPLSQQEIQRRRQLTRLFSDDRINPAQAQELRDLLEREKSEAAQQGNFLALLAIAFLIGLVVGYIASQQ